MNFSKNIVKAAILAVTMAVYSVFLQPMWVEWLKTQGYTVGFGEIALGWFFMILIAFVFTHFLTRGMGKKE